MLKALLTKIYRRLRFHGYQLRHLSGSGRPLTYALPDGSPFVYPFASDIGRRLAWGDFETVELAFMRRVLRPGQIVLDIGANAGAFAITAARCVGPEGRVFAFEPGLSELELLRRNLALNELTSVTVVPKAVSDTSGTTRFAVSRDGAMSSLAVTRHPLQRIDSWREVETTSVDEFVAANQLQTVNFLKVDVEGAERLALAGARDLLTSGGAVVVLFEASDLNAVGFGYTVEAFLGELRALGLELYYLGDSGRPVKITGHRPEYGGAIYNFVAATPAARQLVEAV